MDTAILLDADVFEEADREADQLQVSLPVFCAMAIREFVANHHKNSITAQVDAIYGKYRAKIDDDILQAQYDGLGEETW